MPTCPAGHASGADDYCDVCGTRIAGASATPPGVPGPSTAPHVSAGAPAGGGGEACPDCGAPRTGRFCEGCGYDFAIGAPRPAPTGPLGGTPTSAPTASLGPPHAPAPATPPGPAAPFDDEATGKWPARPSTPGSTPVSAPAAAGWTAVVNADRDYYETVLRQSGGDTGFAFPPYCPEREIPLDRPQVRIGRRSVSQGTVPEIDLGEPPEDPGVSHTHAVLLARPDGTWTLVDPGSTNGTTVNGAEDPIPVNVEVPVKDGDRIHVGVWTTITLRRG